ncbi:MAG: class I SAM-dependent methyltransferase [bacterium]|nr:class I SAM-dependent methyltransferase [bacterium]
MAENFLEEKISVREKISRTTDRPLEFYRQFLNINPEYYDSKSILNIGAGRSDLAQELKEKNIEPRLLVNLDLAYKNVGESVGPLSYLIGKSFNGEDVPKEGVAGDMKILPFKDQSMDSIFFLWSLGWLKEKDRPQAISEALRVVRDGGEIKIYPVSLPRHAKETIGQNFPFIEIGTPGTYKSSLLKAGTENKSIIDVAQQYLLNTEKISMEVSARLIESMRGKEIGSLSIHKNNDTDKIKIALEELSKCGFSFE